MRVRISPATKRAAAAIAALLVIAYLALAAVVWRAMHKPPEEFGRVMAKMPAPVVFMLFPFESFWTRERAGQLTIGDQAPDFSLMKLDKSERIQLSELNKKSPVVLVFGSYT